MGSFAPAVRGFIVICLLAGIVPSDAKASEPVAPESNRRWNTGSIQLSLSRSLFRPSAAIKSGSSVSIAAESAATAWSKVAAVSLRFAESESDSVSDARSSGDGKNLITVAASAENVVLFPKEAGSPPAYTRLFFDRRGWIIEADIVLNPYVQFSTDGTVGTFDLESVIRHEVGHVLGLGHSPAMGAVMYGRIPPNREPAEQSVSKTQLSDSDVSMVRALYGPEKLSVDCCVSIAGDASGKSFAIWIEEQASGRLVAGDVFAGRQYSLGGFRSGKYRVLVQPIGSGSAVLVAEREFELPARLKNFAFATPAEAHIKFIGLNGELGAVPIWLSRGHEHQIFLGGVGLDPKSVSFGFSSPAISVVEGTTMAIDYGRGISAVAFRVRVEEGVAAGEYSVFAESANGSRRYLIGAISVH